MPRKPPAQLPTPRWAPKLLLGRAMNLYDNRQYTTALSAFREAAEKGSVEAMMYVAMMYAGGQGTLTNPKEALTWFNRAADARR